MDQVAEVRNKTDIVSLIQSFLPLKKAGHNFKACCPFHNEKSPSFVVSPERQIWHCFGCGKSGDAFSFLMEYEHMEFPEALRILAEKAGIQLTQRGFDTTTSSKKEKLYKLNKLASEYYHFLLTKHAVGKGALTYLLEERTLRIQTINTYMIGFSPYSNKALTTYLMQKKQYTPQELLDAGLANITHGQLTDFFQGRLMFPLYDHRGNVIGFSGRIIEKNQFGGKYINTRETFIYHKGDVFFGLHASKEAIKKEGKAIIMEGEFDVIAAFQEGITNTVAVKGTALTENQVQLLSRFAKTVSLCFDSDKAGQEAMKRSLPILEKKGVTIMAVTIPGGKDPDDAIKANPVSFKNAIRHDRPVYDVLLEQLLSVHDPNMIDGKKTIGEDMLDVIYTISNEIVKEHYLRLLSQTIHTSYEALVRELEKKAKKEVVKKDVIITKEKRSREEILEEYLLGLLVQHQNPGDLVINTSNILKDYQWIRLSYKKLLQILEEYITVQAKFSQKEFGAHVPEELVSTFDESYLLPLPVLANEDAYVQEVKKTVQEIVSLFLKKQMRIVTEEIQQKEKEQDEINTGIEREKLSKLLKRFSEIKSGRFSFESKSDIL
jgi:DNA primase